MPQRFAAMVNAIYELDLDDTVSEKAKDLIRKVNRKDRENKEICSV